MTKIYCSNCGQLIADKSNYCRYCGVPQHGSEALGYKAEQAPLTADEKPSTTQAVAVELVPRQHLGSGAYLSFLLDFMVKTGLILLLGIVGSALAPNTFIPFLAVYLILLAVSALLVYNNYFFEISDDGLSIASGIIMKKQVTVPFDQIQNVNIERTLLDRILGVSRLSVETAGASDGKGPNGAAPRAEAYLPGIDLAFAKKIHDILVNGAEANR